MEDQNLFIKPVLERRFRKKKKKMLRTVPSSVGTFD